MRLPRVFDNPSFLAFVVAAAVLVAAVLVAAVAQVVEQAIAQAPPAPVYVPAAGGDAKAAAATGRPVLLEYGGTFAGPLALRPGQSLGAYGDATKGRPQIVISDPNANGVACDGGKNGAAAGVTITNVVVAYTGKLGTSKGKGITVTNASGSRVLDNWVFGFRMGVTNEGYNGRRVRGFEFLGNVVDGCRDPGDGHSAALYLSYTDDGHVVGNTFTNNGASAAADAKFNQTVYLHGSCGAVEFRFNTIAIPASYALQHRAGGDEVGNLFIGAPIGRSWGFVNGESVVAGGVRGELAWNAFLGSSLQSNGERRGWASDIANVADGNQHDELFEGDAESFDLALKYAPGSGVWNASAELAPAKWKLRRAGLYVDWPGGDAYDKRGAIEPGVILRPPKGARGDALRALGGVDAVIANAKRDPRNAARNAIPIAFKARGLPTPPWVPPETLELVIRTRPQDLRAVMENGKPVLKTGDTSTWDVAGDKATRR